MFCFWYVVVVVVVGGFLFFFCLFRNKHILQSALLKILAACRK